jgi:Ricin-type beta-trefoil lectin domain-like
MKKIILFILLLQAGNIFSQSAYQVTESAPANVGGLVMGYTIKSEEEKEVRNKGNFSRFSVKFYVTNSTQEAKIILYKDGFNPLGNVSDQLAQFNCLNATGARLTSKSALIQAAPCNVMALVDDKDGSGKAVKNKRFVQIGYWIKAGQTFSTSAIVIVPLNEKPNMEVVYLANSLQPVASAGYNGGGNNGYGNNSSSGNNDYGGNQNIPPPPPPQQQQGPAFTNGFVKLRNTSTNNYINLEKGTLGCSAINNEWWSAQWQFTPVTENGVNYYTIQNRWKGSFLSLDRNGLVLDNGQSNTALWVLETLDGGNTYTIKNGTRNAALADANGIMQAGPLFHGQTNAKWVIEQ